MPYAVTVAHANWQYPGEYVGDGYYMDSGMRMTLAVRGGGSYASVSANPNAGTLTQGFDDGGNVVVADISSMVSGAKFSKMVFAAGAAVGATLPNIPNWRLEGTWEHIGRADYTKSPVFDEAILGTDTGEQVIYANGAAALSLSTDVLGVMAYYDFFDGLCKPLGTFIPYIGFGVGYADSTTTIGMATNNFMGESLVPTYGDVVDEFGAIQFYESKYSNGNVAGMLALGLSYGLMESVFLDLSARLTYIPQVKFTLSSEDGTRHRDWYTADNMIYVNAMLGLRFEF
jgi:hypothetical protein